MESQNVIPRVQPMQAVTDTILIAQITRGLTIITAGIATDSLFAK